MDSYLAQAPAFVVPPVQLPRYEEFPLARKYDRAKFRTSARHQQYYQYYSKLNTDGLLFEPYSDSATARYYKEHRLYSAQVDLQELTADSPNQPAAERPLETSNLVNFPDLLAGDSFPHLIHHSVVRMGHRILLFGGLELMPAAQYETYLRELTDDFSIAPANIHMHFDYELPAPLSKAKLTSLALRPNKNVYTYNSETSTLLKTCELDGVKTPPPLLCSGLQQISAYHFMLHAGFELHTHVEKRDGHVHITRTLAPQTAIWMFDIRTQVFTQLKAILSSSISTILPHYIPRFGHKIQGITIEQNNSRNDDESLHSGPSHDPTIGSHSRFPRPAVVFVMGGYKIEQHSNRLVALNDLWKCELSASNTTDPSSRGFQLEFSTETICSLVGNPDILNDRFSFSYNANGEPLGQEKRQVIQGLFRHGTDAQWPKPRGFFSMDIVQTTDLEQMAEGEWAEQHPHISHPKPKSYRHFTGLQDEARSPSPTPSLQAQLRSSSPLSATERVNMRPLFPYEGRMRSRTPSSTEETPRSSPNAAASQFSSLAVRSSSLVVFGGSSILHIKVVAEDGSEHVYSKVDVLSDMWWFDLNTETWTSVRTVKQSDSEPLKLCGHASASDGQQLMVIGGLRGYQLDDKLLAIQYSGDAARQYLDIAERAFDTISENVGPGINRDVYDFFVLNFATRQWKHAETRLYNAKKTLTSGRFINVHVQALQFDSKVVICGGGDARIVDSNHLLLPDEQQDHSLGGAFEILSSLMKF
ncbi:hypothetical protein KL911_005036 [Ogataea haglerorum]|uniref:uncharacterized protein n=1 Tax=Ogataea haglerorum TaxID=1937702 RepID=UPI001C8AB80F|nr:uncharacterized protein KL911_005036 [Ogataea haglerorum]KAG7691761.1 hypothetical protein KL915_005068 [Ogataea haglerorum]KAG7744942.1 hypothetical protein KL912_005095 [Ogataea haglerorum]KAG7749829.1 hypothetical protein KL911_005036 [Ogataea haglerorum]KAG7783744.1 hypothetical protein KL945_004878 [Ogataea haglerorum]KAG7784512.1 hypothetical protein KL910_005125 [Ogataea haglerorum]